MKLGGSYDMSVVESGFADAIFGRSFFKSVVSEPRTGLLLKSE